MDESKKYVGLDNMESIIGTAKIGGSARVIRPIGKYKKGQKIELFNEKNKPNKYTLKLLERGDAVINSGEWIWDDVEDRLMPKDNSLWINVDARRTLLLKKWNGGVQSKLQRVKVNRWFYKPEWTASAIKKNITDVVESQMEDQYSNWTEGNTGIFAFTKSPFDTTKTEFSDTQIEAQRIGSEYEPLQQLQMYNVSFIDTKENVYETDTTNKCVFNALQKRFGKDKGFLGKLVNCERALWLYLNTDMDKKGVKQQFKKKTTIYGGKEYNKYNSDFGVNTNQLIKLCRDFNKKLVAINMDDNIIASHYPEKPDRNGARSIFYRIKHNHLYLMTDGADMRRFGYKASKNNKKMGGKRKDPKEIKVPEDFCEQKDYKEPKLWEVEEVKNLTKLDPKFNHFIYTDDLKDLFYEEYEKGRLLSDDLVCNREGDIIQLKSGEINIYAVDKEFSNRLENIKRANKYIAKNFKGKKEDLNFINWMNALFNEGCILEEFFYKLYHTNRRAISSRLTTDFWDLLKKYEERPNISATGWWLGSFRGMTDDAVKNTPCKIANDEEIKEYGYKQSIIEEEVKKCSSKCSFTTDDDYEFFDLQTLDGVSGDKDELVDFTYKDVEEYKKNKKEECVAQLDLMGGGFTKKTFKYIKDGKYEYWDIYKAYYTAMTKINNEDFMIFDEMCRVQQGGSRHLINGRNYLYLTDSGGFSTIQQLQYLKNIGQKFKIIAFIRPVGYMPKDTFKDIFVWVLKNFNNPKDYINQFIGTLSKRYSKKASALFTTDKKQLFATMWDERNTSKTYVPKLIAKKGGDLNTKPLYALFEYNYWEKRYSQSLMRIQIVGLCNMMLRMLINCVDGNVDELITDCVIIKEGTMNKEKLAELPFKVDKKENYDGEISIEVSQNQLENSFDKRFGVIEQYNPFLYPDAEAKFYAEYLKPINWEITEEGEDWTDILPILSEEKRGMITGDAGRGKTYNAKRLIAEKEKMGVKLQPLSFTNKATNNLNGETIHKFFGLNVEARSSQDLENNILEMINNCGIGGFVIDEISMTPRICWSVLVQLSIRRPDLEFWGFGDWEQLPPVEPDIYTDDYKNHPQIKEMFGRKEYHLTINRRSGEDAEAIENAVRDIKSDKLDIEPFKPNKSIDEYTTHLAYYKEKCKEINRMLMLKNKPESAIMVKTPNMDFNEEMWLYNGLPLISMKNVKDDGIAKNEDFILDRIENTTIYIKREDYGDGEEIEYKFEVEDFIRSFCARYCITIHRSQGDTIKGEFLIHNWKKIEELKEYGYMNDLTIRAVRYVAFTRTTSIDNVKILPF
tara:strand:- start:584 stop:4480 length:3897 start_codon:yes stop_codon:yes gene_type:complete